MEGERKRDGKGKIGMEEGEKVIRTIEEGKREEERRGRHRGGRNRTRRKGMR